VQGRKCKEIKGVLLGWLIIALLFPIASYAAGFEVDPVRIIVENCPLGEKVSVSALAGEEMILKIQNKEPVSYTYTINVLRSSQSNTPVGGGYSDIPDTFWIIPEDKEVQIPGNSTKKVKLYLNIPKKQEYYNKKYQAVIGVKRKKDKPQDMFVLAVQIRMRFSTIKMEVGK